MLLSPLSSIVLQNSAQHEGKIIEYNLIKSSSSFSFVLTHPFFLKLLPVFHKGYSGSRVSTVFAPPGNCIIEKTVQFGDWFSYKIAIYDFWIFKFPFFLLIFKLFWFLKLKKWSFGFILKHLLSYSFRQFLTHKGEQDSQIWMPEYDSFPRFSRYFDFWN